MTKIDFELGFLEMRVNLNSIKFLPSTQALSPLQLNKYETAFYFFYQTKT